MDGADMRNLDRVRILISLFGLTVAEVARGGGVSRPYVSRALDGSLVPSPQFYRRLESNLGRLVENRSGQIFSVPVTPVDAAGLLAVVAPCRESGRRAA
jgi:transcriptional regulator with XRE-family HTH domain